MKIIIYVDFKDEKFNRDFALSQKLTAENTVLMVTNDEQLYSSIDSYDILLFGFSCEAKSVSIEKTIMDLVSDASLEELEKLLKG
ncbi:MAG: hypothetical protein E7354_01105 [Clostridiales bacterium]|nr:hypothetical protein [Clostridiales bacterium]